MTHRRRFDLIHAQLIDIDRALTLLRKLQPKAYRAVLLVGILGLDIRLAGILAGTSKTTIDRQYRHAINTMTDYLNAGRRN